MMTSSRPAGDLGGSFATRRGHSSQLSISDPSHHVTEAIGTLYGDEDDSGSDSGRPLSFVGGPSYQDQIYRQPLRQEPQDVDPRRQLVRSQSEQTPGPSTSSVEMGSFKKSQTLPVRSTSQRAPHSMDYGSKSPGGASSPTPSLRDFQQADSSKFPLTDINNPSDIAQELSNLQALRRLSMDVGSMTDPDMPPMTLSAIPAIAPSGDDDENDPSRLLWVPARVHPELAPSEFQTFLEKRVQSIRRRSGESMLSVDGDVSRSDSGSSLSPGSIRRQKSKLSRQIDNSGGRGAMGYVDGAERLERKRSQGHSRELSLDELVKDPTKAVQKLAQESQDHPVTGEGSNDDKPILPMAPGMGLRRSTRTTYRKGGSLRSGDRPFSRRLANRNQESEASDNGVPAMPEAPPGHGLTRVHSEPIADNYSRPNRSVRRQNKFSQEPLPTVNVPQDELNQGHPGEFDSSQPQPRQEQLPLRTSSSDQRLTGAQYGSASPRDEQQSEEYSGQYGQYQTDQSQAYPERSSSQAPGGQTDQQPEPGPEEPPARSNRRAGATSTTQHSQQTQYNSRTPSQPSQPSQPQNLSDSLAAHSGAAASRTDNLTFIPTFNQEERRAEKKSKRDDDTGSVNSTKSSGSGWKWFKSGAEDKEKKKEESKKSKTKSLVEKAQDNVRLDVIQNSIDKTSPKGRESLVLDRDGVDSKLQEERKKDGPRKSDGKKEKDGNIFSSIFGGSKRKEEKEKTSKKSRHLEVPEEPVYKPLQPDVDYHWTRFPLLEERAIYRMAHIKLANPRRSLLSQVLLSNFMYSYLAIVQAMHPQMNVPTSPQQKRLEEEARRKQQEEEYLAQQSMQDDQDSGLGQYDFDYHRAAVQYADSGNGQVDYVDDAQIYEDEHGRDNNDYAYDGSDGYGQGSKEYYQYHGNGEDRRHDRRDDMW